MDQAHIRNFCIIAHIDHGKSTLADRFLEVTHTVEKRKMQEQLLDKMELERERGITIKLKPVRMQYRVESHKVYKAGSPSDPLQAGSKTLDFELWTLNLIDTPGHVDFTYEVSRSLAAVEGAILLVDATQGIQAQTLANLHLAQRQGLTIVPVLNKMDLSNADVPRRRLELARLVNCIPEDVLAVSAKTGKGVREVLEAVIERIPAPKEGINDKSIFRAFIFDSQFDEYRGVIAYVRVYDGTLNTHDTITLIGTDTKAEVLSLGYLRPHFVESDSLSSGEIGYIITNIKEIAKCRVGDTMVAFRDETQSSQKSKVKSQNEGKDFLKLLALPGYQEAKPMVYAGIFPVTSNEYQKLRSALEKLQLTDASLHFEPEHSKALGFGYRCGFLGLLHLDIIKERINREFDIELIMTVPSVGYHVFFTTNPNDFRLLTSAEEFSDPSKIIRVEEPVVSVEIAAPQSMIGKVMGLFERYQGEYVETQYPTDEQAILVYRMPLSEILVDFHDSLKSVTAGYASMGYGFFGYQAADVVKMDILVNRERVEALSMIVYQSRVYEVGKQIVEKLKESLPRQMFEMRLQAAVGSNIVAAERLSALRKDVTAKLSGGDMTRRRKLLEKQKKGKKKMLALGKISIPQNVYLEILKR